MLFKNQITGEEINVSNLTIKNDRIFFSVRGKGCGQRFFNRNTCLVLDEHVEDGTYLKTAEGWEVIKKKKTSNERKPKAEKPQPQPQPEPVPANEPAVFFTVNGETFRKGDRVTIETVDAYDAHHTTEVGTLTGYSSTQALAEVTTDNGKKVYGHFATVKHSTAEAEAVEVVEEEPKEETAREVENVPTTDENANEQALIAAIKNLRGGAVDIAKVREIIHEELSKLATAEPAKVKAIIKKASNSKDYKCGDFEEIADYIAHGQPVYMYGAAGCGKSHTAEQIASALNLDYYTQSQVLFAHDVKGYGDANGAYQETPFFKAFTKGGLFFIDEMDASAPEALVVLNTAIANRRYDFPIIGCVEAHPNFRIIAAGNTALTGADVEYTARSVQDASTINRFAFFEMHYEKNVEFNVMAKGDKDLYNFVVDLRNAIKTAGIQLCVSYRQTSILASDLAQKYGKAKALKRNVFGGRETDEIRIIYGSLKNKDNAWAKAMEELIK